MTRASQASAQKESDSSTSKTLLHKSPETVNKPEAVNQTAAKPSESKACREFRDNCLKNYPWLEYDGHKMTCKTCVAEGKDNPFTSGCTFLGTLPLSDTCRLTSIKPHWKLCHSAQQ